MYFELNNDTIPGTILKKKKMGNVTGMEFLDKIFFISRGVMLAQVREISGVDGSTLQNWVKRGWVVNPKNKLYDRDQLARILIINMMRDTMQLSKISFLLTYINGDPDCREDDIIPESNLFDYICRITDHMIESDTVTEKDVLRIIDENTSDYKEKFAGAKNRLTKALEIIVITYCASLIKQGAEDRLSLIEKSFQ